MARIELAPEVLDDFDRFLDHMLESGVTDAPERIATIIDSLQILSHSPLLGKPSALGQRELVVGKGVRGYQVRYRYVEQLDTVFVLAVRNQRESAYRRD
jgi:plasmid stabilization system protein ParE